MKHLETSMLPLTVRYIFIIKVYNLNQGPPKPRNHQTLYRSLVESIQQVSKRQKGIKGPLELLNFFKY